MMKTVGKILLAVIGVILAAAGIVCIANPMGAMSTVAWVIGVALLASGIMTAVFYFVSGSFLVFAFPVLINAVADILFGLLFLNHPDGTSRAFTIAYGLILIGVGLTSILIGIIARRFVMNQSVPIGAMILGLAIIVLGVVALASGEAGAFLVAIPIGLLLLLLGAGYIALDVMLIRHEKAQTPSPYFKDVD